MLTSHLLYMDDIMYARSEWDFDSLIHITKIYRNDKMIQSEGVELPEGNIGDVGSSLLKGPASKITRRSLG